jgi:hypothetical protein
MNPKFASQFGVNVVDRLVLCQQRDRLQLWYVQTAAEEDADAKDDVTDFMSPMSPLSPPPLEGGVTSPRNEGEGKKDEANDEDGGVTGGVMPLRPVQVMSFRLKSASCLMASAMSPDGSVVAASNRLGTKLFKVDLGELAAEQLDCAICDSIPSYA